MTTTAKRKKRYITAEQIKEIRQILELQQADLAAIIGVTPAAVSRYEKDSGEASRSALVPEVEKKLVQLHAMISDSEQCAKLLEIRQQEGGIEGLAGLLAISVATFTVSAGVIGSIGLASLLATPAVGVIAGAAALGKAGAMLWGNKK